MDPRLSIIERRLADIGGILAVAAGKGGVGKSTIASGLALVLADRGRRVGLLDLDFHGPTTHLILGAPARLPQEEKGILPVRVEGIELMSPAFFSGDRAAPLRGKDVSNAFVEMLSVTRWTPLDILIVDLPPGTGDMALDAMRLLEPARYLVVTTPSRLATETVRKTIALLIERGMPIAGVLENMGRPGDPPVAGRLDCRRVPVLGSIPDDPGLEDAVGCPGAIRETRFYRALATIAAGSSGLSPGRFPGARMPRRVSARR